jgi:hypothetical protein
MTNSLAPSYLVINYHSAFGAHKMTLPTLQFHPGVPNGSFDVRGGGTMDAADMVDDFLTLAVPFWPDDVEFDYYQVFLKADAAADSVLAASKTLTQVGTNATPGWTKATEAIWSFKSDLNGLWKLSMLDMGNNDGWDKVTFADLSGASLAFNNYIVDGTHGWAARDNGQPVTFLQISYGLNKALRRKYNMN